MVMGAVMLVEVVSGTHVTIACLHTSLLFPLYREVPVLCVMQTSNTLDAETTTTTTTTRNAQVGQQVSPQHLSCALIVSTYVYLQTTVTLPEATY